MACDTGHGYSDAFPHAKAVPAINLLIYMGFASSGGIWTAIRSVAQGKNCRAGARLSRYGRHWGPVIVTRPAGKTLEKDQIAEFSRLNTTMVIFLGTEKLGEITAKLACPQETPAAVVYHASWPDQKVVRGTVADIAAKARAAGIEHTALLLIGGVVGTRKEGHTTSYLYS